jgi:cell division transport system permease protein
MSEPVEYTAGSRTRPNYLYSIVSVSLVLLLLGFFGLILLQGRELVRFFKERVNLMVELSQESSKSQLDELTARLESSRWVKSGSVRFISKEEALESLRADFGDEFLQLDMANPLYDVLLFNVNAGYVAPDSLSKIRTTLLEQHSNIHDVFYQESLVDVVAQNLQRIGWIALGIGLFFIFVAFTLIHNTIRLALYANRFLIKNMELVGASWEFISRPIIWKSFRHGFLSGLIAVAVLGGAFYLFLRDFPELAALQDWPAVVVLFIFLIFFGILITTTSTYYVVNKYLKMRVDDLY